jgi:hypothetical protein
MDSRADGSPRDARRPLFEVQRMSMGMSQQGRRRVVAVVWIGAGIFLFIRGMPYNGLWHSTEVVSLSGNDTWIALGIGLLVGLAKGFTLLKKGARRAVTNIVKRGEYAPWWTVFAPSMILLVGLMIVFGVALRKAPYDDTVKAWLVGSLYPGIGLALVIGGLLATSVPPLEPKHA